MGPTLLPTLAHESVADSCGPARTGVGETSNGPSAYLTGSPQLSLLMTNSSGGSEAGESLRCQKGGTYLPLPEPAVCAESVPPENGVNNRPVDHTPAAQLIPFRTHRDVGTTRSEARRERTMTSRATNGKTRAAIYARVSKDDGSQQTENQLRILREEC